NLGEAHSAQFVEALMRRLDPEKHRLILSTYGRNARRIQEAGAKHAAVRIVDFVPRHHLRYIDIHLVTLLGEWTHVCVPSKAVSAICAGSTMLFCGAEHCDSWQMLQEAGWRIDHLDGMEQDLDAFMASVTREQVASRKANAQRIARDLEEMRRNAYQEIAAVIETGTTEEEVMVTNPTD
ncbi:MAG: hypothetical protein R3330_06940, partial [Saprospiraceae bacterium]|nr:hypothetical protein [Saprospiraceae bacterium]